MLSVLGLTHDEYAWVVVVCQRRTVASLMEPPRSQLPMEPPPEPQKASVFFGVHNSPPKLMRIFFIFFLPTRQNRGSTGIAAHWHVSTHPIVISNKAVLTTSSKTAMSRYLETLTL